MRWKVENNKHMRTNILVSRRKILLLIFITFLVKPFYSNALTPQSETIKIDIDIENTNYSKDHNLKLIFYNISEDTISLAWSDLNIFLNNPDLPQLSIFLYSSNTSETYLIRDNVNGLNFKNKCEILKIPPNDSILKVLNLFQYFGDLLPMFDKITVKYENEISSYDCKDVFIGTIYSNQIKL